MRSCVNRGQDQAVKAVDVCGEARGAGLANLNLRQFEQDGRVVVLVEFEQTVPQGGPTHFSVQGRDYSQGTGQRMIIRGAIDQLQLGSSLLEVANRVPAVVYRAVPRVVARFQRRFEPGFKRSEFSSCSSIRSCRVPAGSSGLSALSNTIALTDWGRG